MEIAFEEADASASDRGYSSTDDVIDDLRRSLAAQDWARAVGVIGAHWSLLLDEVRGVLDEALQVIPLPAFARDPRAAAIRDVRLHTSADEVDRMLGQAVLPDVGDLTTLDEMARSPGALNLLSVVSARMIALRVRGRVARAVQLADLVERFGRIAVVHQPAMIASRLPTALLHAGITRGLADDIPRALLTLRDAHERGPNARANYVQRDAAGKAAFFLSLAGEMRQAELWLRRYDEAPVAHGWLKPRIALTADIARSLIATEGLRESAASAALALLDQPVNAEQSWGPAVTYARARYALAWGDRIGGAQMVRQDRDRYAEWLVDGTALRPLLAMAESELLLSTGRAHPARHLLAEEASHPLISVARARAEVAAGNYSAADQLALAALSSGHSARARVEAFAVLSASEARREAPTAGATVADFLRAADAQGLLLSTMSVPRAEHAELDGSPDIREVRATLPEATAEVRLTDRQLLVLRGMQRGLTLRQIGARMHLSVNTMKTHTNALYRRLGVSSRDDAVVRGHELGLL